MCRRKGRHQVPSMGELKMSITNTAIRDIQSYIRLPLCYRHWYVAGFSSEFGRDPVGKTLLEKSVVFYRTEAGDLVALQNRCLHRSYPLSESTLKGDNIVCGYHGIEDSPAGEIVDIPCQKQCPKKKLKKYPVKEIGQLVLIWMDAEEDADQSKIPDLTPLQNGDCLSVRGYKFIKGNYLMMQENLNDLTHFTFLHANTFGSDEALQEFGALPIEYEERNGITGCYRIDERQRLVKAQLGPEREEIVGDRHLRNVNGGVSYSPGIWLGENFTHVADPQEGHPGTYRIHVYHFMTPEKHNTCHYWYSLVMEHVPYDEAAAEAIGELAGNAFEEDLIAVELMQKLLDDDRSEYKDMNINGDKSGVLFRRKMFEWVQEEYPEFRG